jgi:arabinose-5-phosphate isomerase
MTPAEPKKHESGPAADEDSLALTAARRVLTTEGEALAALGAALDQRFALAVETLAQVSGRVVVSGIGKSGHVARKIAATFASTGSPAQFVHPSEASHGDLGMITRADAVLILSNSGESTELNDLVAHSRRCSIPLIAVTRDGASTLATAADIALELPKVAEACPMGLAPTTSTTMMLALGDALAVALMERRGFSVDDYRVLHPGGELGKALIRVADIMHGTDALPLVEPETLMSEVIVVMTAKGFGCAGVVDGTGCLIGVITDGDLRRHMGQDLLAQKAEAVMTAAPKTIRTSALAAEAVAFMNNSVPPFLCVFVVDDFETDGRPAGILHMHDCLKAGVA